MTNTIVTRRNFDQPVLYTLSGPGDGLFVRPGVAVGLTTPGVAVSGQNRDLLIDIEGTLVGARGVDAIDIDGRDATVRVGSEGRIAARDFGVPEGGHSVDLARGGKVVNRGSIDAGVEVTAGRESTRIVNIGTIGAFGENREGINILNNDATPDPATRVTIVNTGSVLGTTMIDYDGVTNIVNRGFMAGSTTVDSDPGGAARVEVRNRAGADMNLDLTAGRVNAVNQGTMGYVALTGDSLRFVNQSDVGGMDIRGDAVTRVVNSGTIDNLSFDSNSGEIGIRNLDMIERLSIRNGGADVVIGNEGTIGSLGVAVGGDVTVINNGTIEGQIGLVGSGDNRFDGQFGTQVNVTTGSGNDFVRGSEFADILTSGTGDDLVIARAGNDRILTGGHNNTVAAGDGNDTVRASGFIVGGNGDDTMTGAGRLEGRDGDDMIRVWRVAAEFRTETIDGFAFGGDGNDTISIGAPGFDSDRLPSGTGSTLDGGAGDDVLYVGPTSAGVVIGGDGADTFSVDTARRDDGDFRYTQWGRADIQDFEDGMDRFDFAGLRIGDLDLSQVGNDVEITRTDVNGSFVFFPESNDFDLEVFTVAIVRDTDIALIDASDFIF